MSILRVVYPARIWLEDEVYYVKFLDLDNGFTFGDSLIEAKAMAADVLSALLMSALAHNEPIPFPQQRQGEDIYMIAPNAKVQVALLLHFTRAKLPLEALATAMGSTWQALQKIEQSQANPTLSQLQKAAHALGKELVIEFRD